ncbi:MAG: hypothetical protein RL299_1067, partial [Pseudomonadota bacterium]
MSISLFELFKVGIGPSSSHTVGPMVAARRFGDWLTQYGLLERTRQIRVDLYGSLALTGKGHATDNAVILGLCGFLPATVNIEDVPAILARVRESHVVTLAGTHEAAFDPEADLVFRGREKQPFHTNAMAITALDGDGDILTKRMYYSIGGGFVVDEDEAGSNSRAAPEHAALPYDFASGAELLELGEKTGLSFAELEFANECARRPETEVIAGIDAIAQAMSDSIDRGCREHGILPGGLNVRRRAPTLAAELAANQGANLGDPLAILDWINLWAMAVNEENAACGRVVTAPTNGAAGIIPAVMRFHDRCYRGTAETRRTFLLTAAAIGALYKKNASISGAEVGCQGEVGVACSMAAAGLAAAMGGTNAQVENAAEIGMEHNLGLTCDPVGGL